MPATAATREYDTRIDSRKRLTLRGTEYEYFRVVHRKDGTILLKPRVLQDATTSEREARLARVVATAEARGESVPHGVRHIRFREPTTGERSEMNAVARELGPLARKRLARK